MADIDRDGRDEVVLKGMNLQLSGDGKHLLPRVLCGDILPMLEGTGRQPAFGENMATEGKSAGRRAMPGPGCSTETAAPCCR